MVSCENEEQRRSTHKDPVDASKQRPESCSTHDTERVHSCSALVVAVVRSEQVRSLTADQEMKEEECVSEERNASCLIRSQ